MKPSDPAHAFDLRHAATYDERWAPLSALRDSLHLQMRFILRELPDDARVLCVGVGTGAELLALAAAFPRWRFVAVDPSAPMLEVCRRKAEEAGIAARCEFHAAYVNTLPPTELFDAATTILVSQFITDRTHRVAFFRDMAARMRSGGLLITADLSLSEADRHESLLGVWRQMMRHVGASEEQIQTTLANYGREVALLPVPAMEVLLAESGFSHPVHFYQSLLIHGWYARKP